MLDSFQRTFLFNWNRSRSSRPASRVWLSNSSARRVTGAGLNYCDCFTYALAKAMGEPLVFKGSNFALTDLVPAI